MVTQTTQEQMLAMVLAKLETLETRLVPTTPNSTAMAGIIAMQGQQRRQAQEAFDKAREANLQVMQNVSHLTQAVGERMDAIEKQHADATIRAEEQDLIRRAEAAAMSAFMGTVQDAVHTAAARDAGGAPIVSQGGLPMVRVQANDLCNKVEYYEARRSTPLSQEPRLIEWLETCESLLLTLSQQLVQTHSALSDSFADYLRDVGKLSPAQLHMLKNFPLSERLFAVYVKLRAASPGYDAHGIILRSMKALQISRQTFQSMANHYADPLLPYMTAIVTQETDRIGQELVNHLWQAHPGSRAVQENFDKKAFWVDINLPKSKLLIDNSPILYGRTLVSPPWVLRNGKTLAGELSESPPHFAPGMPILRLAEKLDLGHFSVGQDFVLLSKPPHGYMRTWHQFHLDPRPIDYYRYDGITCLSIIAKITEDAYKKRNEQNPIKTDTKTEVLDFSTTAFHPSFYEPAQKLLKEAEPLVDAKLVSLRTNAKNSVEGKPEWSTPPAPLQPEYELVKQFSAMMGLSHHYLDAIQLPVEWHAADLDQPLIVANPRLADAARQMTSSSSLVEGSL